MTYESEYEEWKESWRTEYLKWICGFANASGGVLYIGVDDSGKVVGVKNSRKLLEDIPNQVMDKLEIIVEIDLLSEGKLEYVRVSVTPSPYPVSYDGKYYLRQGSTNQLLKGSMLTHFIMAKTGRHWDAEVLDGISIDELEQSNIDIFKREAVRHKRFEKQDVNIDRSELLSRLDLLVGNSVKRAAAMLFLDRPGRVVSGAYVKIGKFSGDDEIDYQDTLEGSLLNTADRIIDLIFTKYLVATISYDGDIRRDMYPYPREAIREGIYNAIVHNDYSSGVPIQIRVYDTSMYITNSCMLPGKWTENDFVTQKKSKPYNPGIANVFYRAGYIEAWGRGISKIYSSCKEYGIDPPEYIIEEESITLVFKASQSAGLKSQIKVHNGTLNETLNEREDKGLTSGFSGASEVSENGLKSQIKVHNDTLNKTLKLEILTSISENPDITYDQLSQRVNKSLSTIKRYMKQMQINGEVYREGSKKSGKWIIP